ncbi:MAG: DUF2807 domain-containing protein [Phenylobacterium sp.]|uniref:GIN domain-containing protein n=1 Tax=Phenylobacterium sp. TaxID=1871053 RepID=UPI001A553FB8|nr:DUF2807 domain-containing protein [Phenylobacterium sp.]MBL8556235.1 DUF2807 domain-containing protein [Phenylobacterium sp.]
MIRVLVMITVAGFVLSVASLSAAVAIGGPDAIARGSWNIASGHWGDRWDWDWNGDARHIRRGDSDWPGAPGPEATRTLAWSGADKLDIDLPADVRYVQSSGPSSVVVTGPQGALDHIVIRGDSIRYSSRRYRHYPRVSIVLTAPNVSAFDVSGRNTLTIEGYRQPRLSLDVSGEAEVSGRGETDELSVDLSGSGELELGALKARRANVDVSGAADATLAPIDEARLEISGAGDVRLVTQPKTLETDISGAGRVRQVDPTPSPSPSPSPSASPSPSPRPAAGKATT